jgi:hypothetical protein
MTQVNAPLSSALDERIQALREGSAYRNYLRARAEVLEMLDAGGGAHVASEYWLEELEGFQYMLDASPLIVERLRHHTYHLTGLRVYDYRSHRSAMQEGLAAKLAELVRIAGGRELLVPESPLLGGFGVEIDGALYNIDTLKFFEVLIGLQMSGITPLFDGGERRVVWEIGAGWGGFAYAFKTLFPNVTYVISDLPQVMLFSATYLPTMFPDARVEFVQHASSEFPADADFVFVPHTLTDTIRPAHLDLAVNMVSFQEMTSEQVRDYVRHAHALEAQHLYSLNRDRSPYNPELRSVREVIGEYFWPHELEILPVPYTKMLEDSTRRRKPADPGSNPHTYRHVHGLRRVEL